MMHGQQNINISSEVTVGVSSNSVVPRNFVARGPLLASKNNHGSSHPSSSKYWAWMINIQNLKFVTQIRF
jgi:hypothetical protein